MFHPKSSLSALIFFFISIGFFPVAFAQKVLKDIPSFPFLDSTLVKISYPNDEMNLNHFYIKMDSLIKYGKEKVNIVHLGGSHIQADIYTHQLRTNLHSFHPNLIGNRGMVFPFSAASTNNPKNYQSTYKGNWETTKNTQKELKKPLGITGIAITTTDSIAEITLKLPNLSDPKLYFNKVRIIGKNESHAYHLDVFTDSLHHYSAAFDSISDSYLFDLKSLQDSFTLRLSSNDSLKRSFTLQGILLENGHSGLTYHAMGVNGASVSSFLKCDNLERDLELLKPDLVILSLGINDAASENFDIEKFKSNYDLLIQKIRNVAPETSILFTTNNDSYQKKGKKYQVNTNGILAREAFFELAKKNNTGVWDLFSIMGGLHSMKDWESAGLGKKDKVHFTNQGYQLIGDLLFNALINEYIYFYY